MVNAWVLIGCVALTTGGFVVLGFLFARLFKEEADSHDRQLEDLHDRLTSRGLGEYEALHKVKPLKASWHRLPEDEARIERERKIKRPPSG